MPSLFSPRVRQLSLAIALTVSASSVFAAPVDDVISEAQQRIEAQDWPGAYQVLADKRLEFAGDTDFDYWLGLVAVRNGKPADAIFPLERVLAADPNHAGARLELANAYVALGQKESARRELAALEQLDPPENAANRIAELNKAVDRQEQAEQRKDRVIYITGEIGDDDNVGTWPDTRIDILPGAPTIEPIDSTFRSLQAGIWQRFSINSTNSLALSLNGLKRTNSDDDDVDANGDGLPDDGDGRADQFDQDYLSARAEWVHDLDGRHAIAAGVDVAGMDLDGERYYRFYGGYTEWRNRISDTRSYRARLGVRSIDFEEDANSNTDISYDYTQTQLLAGVTYLLSSRWRLNVDANLDYEAAKRNRPGGDASVYGLRGALARQLAAKHRLTLTSYYSMADYKRAYEPFTAFNFVAEERDDTRFGGGLIYEYFPTNSLQLRGRVEYRDQSSSLDAYDFDQTIGSLALSYYL